MTRNIIGIGGRLRAGKDTVADYLVEKYGYTKIGFSDALLDAARVLNPIIEFDVLSDGHILPVRFSETVDLFGYTRAKEIPEVRRFLQVLGTDFGRNMVNEDIWVDIIDNKIMDTWGNVVVTGIRFPNELTLMRDSGALSVWVDRSLTTDEAFAAHASESGVQADQFDIVLDNTGTLEELYAKADQLVGNPN